MTEKVLVELSQEDIKQLVVDRFDLDIKKTFISINYSPGCDLGRDPEHLSIEVIGEKLKS